MKILESGIGELLQPVDINAFREHNRGKPKGLIDKRMTEAEAVEKAPVKEAPAEAAPVEATSAEAVEEKVAAPKKKAAPKKATSKKVAPATAADTVLAIIKRSKKGVGTAVLMEKTGYNQKKISNLVYKLRKQGKIKSVGNGVYLKA